MLSKFWEEKGCKANLDNDCAAVPAAGCIRSLLLLNAMIDEHENRALYESRIIKSSLVVIPKRA